jgi:hypothetical protein
MQNIRYFESTLNSAHPIIPHKTALELLQSPDVGVIAQFHQLAIGSNLSNCMGITFVEGARTYPNMKGFKSKKSKSIENQQLEPHTHLDSLPHALFLQKKVVCQEEEIMLLESAARSHDDVLARTREEIFAHSQNMIEDITFEHEEEAEDLKRRIEELEGVDIVRKIQVVNLQAKVANLQSENVVLREQVSSMQDSLTILLAEHHKKQRLSPTEDSIAAPRR